MTTIEVTRLAREELREPIETRQPRAGKQLSGVWLYIEAEDRVIVIAFHDARTSEAATTRFTMSS